MQKADEQITELFPQCSISNDCINWLGMFDKQGKMRFEPNNKFSYGYISGSKNYLTLDGEFTIDELRALVKWMES